MHLVDSNRIADGSISYVVLFWLQFLFYRKSNQRQHLYFPELLVRTIRRLYITCRLQSRELAEMKFLEITNPHAHCIRGNSSHHVLKFC